MEVYGGRHNRRLIGVRIRRFSVEDLHNRLFLRYKIITEDPDRDLIRVPMIHCALNCRHFESISKRVQTSIDSKIHCTSRQTCNLVTRLTCLFF